MQNDTLTQLKKIAVLKQFQKEEYICCEGQPGDEMYIILTGSVGIYLTNVMGLPKEIARIHKGDFFGEMAIFDKLPRSASCVALEDTICIAIRQEHIPQLIVTCPEIIEKILLNMSMRIREVNSELHKKLYKLSRESVPPFAVPVEFNHSHALEMPYQNPKYLGRYRQACPVCGQEIPVVHIRRNLLKIRSVEMDGRIRYEECEPLWHDVINCPFCNYSNHYLNFFNVDSTNVAMIKSVVQEQDEIVNEFIQTYRKYPFDRLVLHYLQAIYLNEILNPQNEVLLGTLWLKLYWLSRDAMDSKFAIYCAKQAVGKFETALNEDKIEDEKSRCSIALSLASLYEMLGLSKNAINYCLLAEQYQDDILKKPVEDLKANLLK